MEESSKCFAKKGYDIIQEEGKVLIVNDNFSLTGSEENTLRTASAVLCDECYNFSGLAEDKYIVFDIGSNIGTTALYLAGQKNITHIYGFEPFGDTFTQAEYNIKQNPKLSDKISICNFGLSNKNEIVSVHYNKEMSGSMSTVGDKFPDAKQLVTVELKKASEILAPIIENHSEKIMLKIDCEGAEHRIIPELAVAGLLQKIDIIIMEWHYTNPALLLKILHKERFVTFCNHEIINFQGIIRAVKI
jgi:FkbM family methyltransferase